MCRIDANLWTWFIEVPVQRSNTQTQLSQKSLKVIIPRTLLSNILICSVLQMEQSTGDLILNDAYYNVKAYILTGRTLPIFRITSNDLKIDMATFTL